jgi:hypothetical protein
MAFESNRAFCRTFPASNLAGATMFGIWELQAHLSAKNVLAPRRREYRRTARNLRFSPILTLRLVLIREVGPGVVRARGAQTYEGTGVLGADEVVVGGVAKGVVADDEVAGGGCEDTDVVLVEGVVFDAILTGQKTKTGAVVGGRAVEMDQIARYLGVVGDADAVQVVLDDVTPDHHVATEAHVDPVVAIAVDDAVANGVTTDRRGMDSAQGIVFDRGVFDRTNIRSEFDAMTAVFDAQTIANPAATTGADPVSTVAQSVAAGDGAMLTGDDAGIRIARHQAVDDLRSAAQDNSRNGIADRIEQLDPDGIPRTGVDPGAIPIANNAIPDGDTVSCGRNRYSAQRSGNAHQREPAEIQDNMIGIDCNAVVTRHTGKIAGHVVRSGSQDGHGQGADGGARLDLRQCFHAWSGCSGRSKRPLRNGVENRAERQKEDREVFHMGCT